MSFTPPVNGDSDAPRSGMLSTNSNLFFKISSVPQFPFIHTPFDVTISLLDDKGKVPSDVQDLHFSLSLVEDLPIPQSGSDFSHLLNLQKDIDHTFDAKGCCRLSLSFCVLSAAYDCRKFILLAQQGSIFGTSTPMMSVRYRLESPTSISPIIWFKDRGGKKNCVEVPVRLRSPEGVNVTRVNCPIKVELIYADGESVPDQSLLEIINRESRSLMISSQSGECLLRIRIKEVSMRHKGKLFALKISPDILKAPSTKEISSTVSRFIEVRSKIAGLSAPSITSISNPQQFRPPVPPFPKKRKAGELSETSNTYSHPPVPAISSFHPLPALPSIKKMCTSFESRAISFDQHQPYEDDVPNLPPSASTAWILELAHRLEKLKWKIIGLEATPSDPYQTARPVYEMSNPNEELNEIISQCYAQTQTLPRNLENQSPASTLETSEDEDIDFRDLIYPFFDAKLPENSLSFDEFDSCSLSI